LGQAHCGAQASPAKGLTHFGLSAHGHRIGDLVPTAQQRLTSQFWPADGEGPVGFGSMSLSVLSGFNFGAGGEVGRWEFSSDGLDRRSPAVKIRS
jgi:hypothetical protein